MLGSFKRLGLSIAVNATWLAYDWAKLEGNRDAIEALEKLILDWPMDFFHIQGNTDEEREEMRASTLLKLAVSSLGQLFFFSFCI